MVPFLLPVPTLNTLYIRLNCVVIVPCEAYQIATNCKADADAQTHMHSSKQIMQGLGMLYKTESSA